MSIQPKPKVVKKSLLRRTLFGIGVAFILATSIFLAWGCSVMTISMPGSSFEGPLPAITPAQTAMSTQLRGDVEMLARTIGERNLAAPRNYARATDFIEKRFTQAGYTVTRQRYDVDGAPCYNLEAQITGTTKPGEIVILGAHYDSVYGTVGANDNASGVAALLAIATDMARSKPERTLRFVAFANEEPPYFQTDQMGSVVYAKACRERKENITAMLALDGVGYYSDEPKSQHYPFPLNLLYPSTGNFIAFVTNPGSSDLLKRCVKTFRDHAQFPSEGGAGPEAIQGIGWSDHWSFWQFEYPAVMVTDTLPNRYAHYHTTNDSPDKIDYERMARVTEGLVFVMKDLAGAN